MQIHCLHVPVLHEDRQARITWEELDGAAFYRLERRTDDDFETPAFGQTWGDLHAFDRAWGDIEELDESWAQFMEHPADLCIYEGEGEAIPYPEPGYAWSDIHDHWQDWEQLAALDADWETLHNFAPRGLAWQDINNAGEDWAGIHNADLDWQTFHGLLPCGMTWDDMHARYLDWQETQDLDLTWEDFHGRTNAHGHRAFTDYIPVGAKLVAYRVTAYDAQGNTLGTLASWRHKVVPVFERDDAIVREVVAGHKCRVELDALDMQDFGGIVMTLTFDPQLLRIADIAGQTARADRTAGAIADTPLVVEQVGRSWIRFRCAQAIKNSKTWTGLVTLCVFDAVASGQTTLTLS